MHHKFKKKMMMMKKNDRKNGEVGTLLLVVVPSLYSWCFASVDFLDLIGSFCRFLVTHEWFLLIDQ